MAGLSVWMAAVPALSGLVTAAGGAKLARPADTARALRQSGLPAGATVVRAGALTEVLIGSTALLVGGRPAVGLLGLSYAAFAGFVGLALVTGKPISSCGCFGEPDTPPTLAHALLCAVGALLAGGAVLSGPSLPGLGWLMARQPMAGVPFLVLSALAAYAAYSIMAIAPRLSAARARIRAEAEA